MKSNAASNRWSFRSFLVAIVGIILWLINQVFLFPVDWFVGMLSMSVFIDFLVMFGLAPLGIIFGWLARKHRNRHADWAILANVVLLLIDYLILFPMFIIEWLFLMG
ncbi:hypothetical protein [Staphylospora marina]|uniref:hypothetical protein n=1 Tax=Staphylospora marina TaxID=2490858 RepID=UPI000F5BB906|nr:hypothetical protein [Staphylospora marina]